MSNILRRATTGMSRLGRTTRNDSFQAEAAAAEGPKTTKALISAYRLEPDDLKEYLQANFRDADIDLDAIYIDKANFFVVTLPEGVKITEADKGAIYKKRKGVVIDRSQDWVEAPNDSDDDEGQPPIIPSQNTHNGQNPPPTQAAQNAQHATPGQQGTGP